MKNRGWPIIILITTVLFAQAGTAMTDEERRCQTILAGSIRSQIEFERQHFLKSLGTVFHQQASRESLLNQRDHRLVRRNLVVPNGGLCGTTCGANVMRAVAIYLHGHGGEFAAIPEQKVEAMVSLVGRIFNKDARMGIKLSELAPAMEMVAMQANLPLQTELHTTSIGPMFDLSEITPGADELIIASIQNGTNKSGKTFFHAIVITDLNPITGQVSYSDPNDPGYMQRVRIRLSKGIFGYQSAKLDFLTAMSADHNTGVVADWLKIRARTR